MGDLKDMQGFDPEDADNKNILMNQSIVQGDAEEAKDGDNAGYKPPQNLLGDIDVDDGPNTTRERSGTLAADNANDLMGGGTFTSDDQTRPRTGSGEI